MADILFEQRITQNIGLAAETIWQAVNEAYEQKGRAEGVAFPLVFLVLPLAFHRRTATVLATKTRPGAIYKALDEDREIRVGLQNRVQALSDRTFHALSIGFSTGLLLLDKDSERQLIPGRRTQPVTHVTDDVKIIMRSAKRIGQTFAELPMVQIVTTLGVTF